MVKETKNELISIIVPIYNKEKYLKVLINSLSMQTYHNIEIVLVDDGSTDNSREVCESLITLDSRFKYILKKNGGVSTARNLGLDNANGTWIMFVDPDDYLLESCVESLVSYIDDDVDIVACCCLCDEHNEELKKNSFFDEYREFKDDKNDLFYELLDPNYKSKTNRKTAIGVPWGKLYRTSFIRNNNLKFDTDLIRMQDNIFNMYAFEKARKIIYIDEALYVYNIDNVSNYNNKYDKRAVYYYSKINNLRRAFYDCRFNHELALQEFYSLEIMMSKYFFNLENNNTIACKVRELKKYIIENKNTEILKKIKLRDVSNIKEKSILFLLKSRMYYSLCVISSLFFKLKFLKVKK